MLNEFVHDHEQLPACSRPDLRAHPPARAQEAQFHSWVSSRMLATRPAIAHYLERLAGGSLVTGLPKYSGSRIRQRASRHAAACAALTAHRAGEANRHIDVRSVCLAA